MSKFFKILALMTMFLMPVTFAHADAAKDMSNAIKKGDVAKVQQILASGFDVNAKITGSKSTPLIVAAAHPKGTEIIKLLIAAGADLNYRNSKGKSALSYAKDSKKSSVINLLKEAGAK